MEINLSVIMTKISNQNNQELVTIIVTVFNTEEFLEKCLSSIVSQTYCNIEILIIDDGSTDDNFTMYESFMRQDSRIILIQQKNRGVSSARNIGISNAHGKWISFCDSDDWMELDLIESLVSGAVNFDVDFVVSGFVADSYKNKQLYCTGKAGFSSALHGGKNTLSQDFIYAIRTDHVLLQSPWAKLFKKTIVDNLPVFFNDQIVCYEDFDFILRYMCSIEWYSFINIEKYHYVNQVGKSAILKRSKDDLVEEIYVVYKSLINFFGTYGDCKLKKLMRSWLFEAYRIPLVKMSSIKNYNTKKRILDHLMTNKGYIDITRSSLTHRIMKLLYIFRMYRLIVLIVEYHIL